MRLPQESDASISGRVSGSRRELRDRSGIWTLGHAAGYIPRPRFALKLGALGISVPTKHGESEGFDCDWRHCARCAEEMHFVLKCDQKSPG